MKTKYENKPTHVCQNNFILIFSPTNYPQALSGDIWHHILYANCTDKWLSTFKIELAPNGIPFDAKSNMANINKQTDAIGFKYTFCFHKIYVSRNLCVLTLKNKIACEC